MTRKVLKTVIREFEVQRLITVSLNIGRKGNAVPRPRKRAKPKAEKINRTWEAWVRKRFDKDSKDNIGLILDRIEGEGKNVSLDEAFCPPKRAICEEIKLLWHELRTLIK